MTIQRWIISIVLTLGTVGGLYFFWLTKDDGRIYFHGSIFIIILILSFLLMYKLSNYLADFKTLKNKSRIDIVFLFVFFVMLFIPMSYLNKDEISQQENRTLTKWHPLINENGIINFEFGKNFEQYFNDRFALRKQLFKINDIKLLLSRNWKTKDVVKGKDNWLFLGQKVEIDSYTNSELFTEEQLKTMDDYLAKVDNYCKLKGKKFYFIIAPNKSNIYSEFFPDDIKKVQDYSRTDQFIDYINSHSKVKVVYPKDEILAKKAENPNELLYWKGDSHWTLLGGYIGYKKLFDVMKKDFKNLTPYEIKAYKYEKNKGDLNRITPYLLKIKDETLYKTPVLGDSVCTIIDENSSTSDVICDSKNSKPNLIMFHDSFAPALIPYMSKTFNKSKFTWKYEIKVEDIENGVQGGADVVVLEIIERHLPLLNVIIEENNKTENNNAI